MGVFEIAIGVGIGVVFGGSILAAYTTPGLPDELIVKQPWYRHDTDITDKSTKQRSGLSVFVDYETGVQYVGTAVGGLTVRVDQEGKPMVLSPKGDGDR